MQPHRHARSWAARTTLAALVTGSLVPALTAPAHAYTAACPAAGSISQGWSSGHDGVDIANGYGTPIYAVGPGTVTVSSSTADPQGYGQYINIRHDDGTVTQYGHMQQRLVAVGTSVSAGQLIAYMGSEGQSSGPHLHLRTYNSTNTGQRGINPISYLNARGMSLPCTPGGGGNPGGGKVFSTWGTSVRVRQSPSTSAGIVTTFGGPTQITVACQSHAESVTAEGYTNDAWSRITSPVTGWISNIYVNDPAYWLPGVPAC